MNNIIATIGTRNFSIYYTDRPTVKAVITRDSEVLLLNDGLLPGGGVDEGETNLTALERELQEELGAKVRDIEYVGQVLQYRDFLAKRYYINAYICRFVDFNLIVSPQDKGEVAFQPNWYTMTDALDLVEASINLYKKLPQESDTVQGKLFNLKTTKAILQRVKDRNIL